MKIFLWVTFLMLIAVAIFAVQNSAAPLITIRFLLWKFETSLVYAILGSIGVGILLALFLWISKAIGSSAQKKDLHKEIGAA
jgi:uncharacterized integral membrane protein